MSTYQGEQGCQILEAKGSGFKIGLFSVIRKQA